MICRCNDCGKPYDEAGYCAPDAHWFCLECMPIWLKREGAEAEWRGKRDARRALYRWTAPVGYVDFSIRNRVAQPQAPKQGRRRLSHTAPAWWIPRDRAPRVPRAVFSACDKHEPVPGAECYEACSGRRYRYQLWWPTGVNDDRFALGVFANPSTATAEKLDPTLKRWRNYCRDWGYGWAVTTNVRAWRETNPKLVPADPLAVGPHNDDHLGWLAKHAGIVVCGWGKLGGARGPVVLDLIRKAGKVPHALKLTKSGDPGHPLYLRADLKPFPIGETNV